MSSVDSLDLGKSITCVTKNNFYTIFPLLIRPSLIYIYIYIASVRKSDIIGGVASIVEEN